MTFVHNINPTILKLGFLEIRWYGLMYVLAFFFVYFYVKYRINQGKTILNSKQLDDLLVWGALGVVIGARLFNVFYYPSFYLLKPWEILFIWKGGMSYFGGLIGLAISAYYFCKKYKLSYLHVADLVVVPMSIGQAFGRIGNFINGELYGTLTTLPWGVKFQNVEGFRHPTQLYQFLTGVIIFVILWFNKDKLKQGQLLALYLILYGIFRFFTEFLRAEIVMWIGPLSLSQVLCIPTVLVGFWLWKKAGGKKVRYVG